MCQAVFTYLGGATWPTLLVVFVSEVCALCVCVGLFSYICVSYVRFFSHIRDVNFSQRSSLCSCLKVHVDVGPFDICVFRM